MPRSRGGRNEQPPEDPPVEDFDKWVKRHRPPTEQERESAQHRIEVERERRTHRELRGLNRHLFEELQAVEAERDLLLGVKSAIARPLTIPFPKRVGPKNPAVFGANSSDQHAEEHVDPKTVSFRNEYDLDIAAERFHNYFVNTVKLWKDWGVRNDIRATLGWFGGDFFSGRIHEDLLDVVQLSPYQCLLWHLDNIRPGLALWRREMDCPIHVVVSYGNHGRDGKKPRKLKAAVHNLDWLIGNLLAREMAGIDGMTFQIADGYFAYVDIETDGKLRGLDYHRAPVYRIGYHHGDKAGFSGGVGGITVGLNRAIARWNKNIHCDLYVGAHRHESHVAQNYIQNGSLIGWSELSIDYGSEYEDPQQSAFLIDMVRRKRSLYAPVFVTKADQSARK